MTLRRRAGRSFCQLFPGTLSSEFPPFGVLLSSGITTSSSRLSTTCVSRLIPTPLYVVGYVGIERFTREEFHIGHTTTAVAPVSQSFHVPNSIRPHSMYLMIGGKPCILLTQIGRPLFNTDNPSSPAYLSKKVDTPGSLCQTWRGLKPVSGLAIEQLCECTNSTSTDAGTVAYCKVLQYIECSSLYALCRGCFHSYRCFCTSLAKT